MVNGKALKVNYAGFFGYSDQAENERAAYRRLRRRKVWDASWPKIPNMRFITIDGLLHTVADLIEGTQPDWSEIECVPVDVFGYDIHEAQFLSDSSGTLYMLDLG